MLYMRHIYVIGPTMIRWTLNQNAPSYTQKKYILKCCLHNIGLFCSGLEYANLSGTEAGIFRDI